LTILLLRGGGGVVKIKCSNTKPMQSKRWKEILLNAAVPDAIPWIFWVWIPINSFNPA
jgi:hypothetical protein